MADAPTYDPWGGEKSIVVVLVVVVLAVAADCIVGKVLDHNLEVEKIRAGASE